MHWLCTSVPKTEQRSGSLKICISLYVYISIIFNSFPHSIIMYTLGNERKEADYIFIHQCCCLTLYKIFPFKMPQVSEIDHNTSSLNTTRGCSLLKLTYILIIFFAIDDPGSYVRVRKVLTISFTFLVLNYLKVLDATLNVIVLTKFFLWCVLFTVFQ